MASADLAENGSEAGSSAELQELGASTEMRADDGQPGPTASDSPAIEKAAAGHAQQRSSSVTDSSEFSQVDAASESSDTSYIQIKVPPRLEALGVDKAPLAQSPSRFRVIKASVTPPAGSDSEESAWEQVDEAYQAKPLLPQCSQPVPASIDSASTISPILTQFSAPATTDSALTLRSDHMVTEPALSRTIGRNLTFHHTRRHSSFVPTPMVRAEFKQELATMSRKDISEIHHMYERHLSRKRTKREAGIANSPLAQDTSPTTEPTYSKNSTSTAKDSVFDDGDTLSRETSMLLPALRDILTRSRATSRSEPTLNILRAHQLNCAPNYLQNLQENGHPQKRNWAQLCHHTRLVHRRGGRTIFNVNFIGITDRVRNTVRDIFNIIMDLTIAQLLAIMFLGFPLMWGIFALFYYVLNVRNTGPDDKSCISDMDSTNLRYIEHFLFAWESQTTVGFGGRHPEDDWNRCWPIILVQTYQPIFAMIIEGCLIMLVFMKLTDARHSKAIYLLKKCCICVKEGKMCLVVRTNTVAQQYASLVGVSINGKCLITRKSLENEWICLDERELEFEAPGLLGGPIPLDLVHIINEDSPLYELGREQLDKQGFQLEIVVSITATFESTGSLFTAMKSYLGQDIEWGMRFKQCIFKRDYYYEVDEDRLDQLEPIEMSDHSKEEQDIGERLHEQRKEESRANLEEHFKQLRSVIE